MKRVERELRIYKCAHTLLETRMSVRELAAHLDMPKTTVHEDVTIRLRQIDVPLADRVQKELRTHINQFGGIKSWRE